MGLVKTKDKIIFTAIELFNQRGEQNVTTNYIAAHLGISPGNLYYHFRNKEEIIEAIFAYYASQMNSHFVVDTLLPPEEQGTLQTTSRHFERLCALIWQFRFVYDNLPDILSRKGKLKDIYHQIQEPVYRLIRHHMACLRSQGVLNVSDADVDNLLHIMKQQVMFWLAYRRAMDVETPVNMGMAYDSILKILFLLRPYITAPHQAELASLEAHFHIKRSEMEAFAA